ncbi:MAG: DNA topoisomerase 4 subunit A [Deltaproteobacteria bacterium]|nr:DNA topoisomerase 4 subunit A [Deltaproteobacteria bacterium]
MLPPPLVQDARLAAEAERRYLAYALSVITSRALPDVRDGLKPVQRRILYAMYEDLRLVPDARFRKSAAVVGEVMGKYHPHGDVAIYDAMVRLAQDFVMHAPLVHGHGNFGSADGDGAAAMRYTEAKLRPLALELLGELGKDTVGFRPNYDATRFEPSVLPARFPHLLVNGSYGIAVGMATAIPPHNLGEVIDACVHLIEAPEPTLKQLLKRIQGPDFPTGGQLQVGRHELRSIYEAGQGSIRLRAQWRLEPARGRGLPDLLVITSVPYNVERRVAVEKIAEVIIGKKLGGLLDVRDESTAETRIVLELKRGTDPQLVMAYLFKHTPLQTSVQINLTCLVPADDGDLCAPRRLGLQELLRQFLDFRFATLTRRLGFERAELGRRIHILEGFELVFDVLDEVIRIVRKSEGKADAAAKLVGRFGLSPEQADAILELKLYRLARLEIEAIRRELAEKRLQERRLGELLGSEAKRWDLLRAELLEIKKAYAVARRTEVVRDLEEPEFDEEDFIAEEDAKVILCASGWVKRVREIKDVQTTRLREGDQVLAALAGSTRAAAAFFSNLGVCYVCRIHDVPASTGYGDPVQKLFKLGDGERIVGALSFDPRVLEVPPLHPEALEPEPPFALAVTRRGLGFRFSLRPHAEPSTRAGRRFARPGEGDEVLAVLSLVRQREAEWVMVAADDGHALAVDCAEIPLLAGAGKGSMVIKLAKEARLLGLVLGHRDLDAVAVRTATGTERSLTLRSLQGPRGGRGHWIVKRGGFAQMVQPPVQVPELDAKPSSGGRRGGDDDSGPELVPAPAADGDSPAEGES